MKIYLFTLLFISLLFISCDSKAEEKTNDSKKEIVQTERRTKEKTESIKKQSVDRDSVPIIAPIKSETSIQEMEEMEISNDTVKKESIELEESEQLIDSINSPETKIIAEPHKIWDQLTRKHISSEGKVNYAGFLADKKELMQYLTELKELHPELATWNKNKRLAYWINMYNAVTVQLVVDNYPVASITDLKSGKPWDTELIELSGIAYTLNVIENKIIRPKFNEPRIHFAVNCAAKSCPKIMNKAWTEHNLERALTSQTSAFLENKEQNTLKEDEIIISKIFEWYKADFGSSDEGIIKFINSYSNKNINANAKVSYNEYDWTLNSK